MDKVQLLKYLEEKILILEDNKEINPELVELRNVIGSNDFKVDRLPDLDPDLLFIVCAKFLVKDIDPEISHIFYNYDKDFFKKQDYIDLIDTFKAITVFSQILKTKKAEIVPKGEEYNFLQAIIKNKNNINLPNDYLIKDFFSDVVENMDEDKFYLIYNFVSCDKMTENNIIDIIKIALLPINNNFLNAATEDYYKSKERIIKETGGTNVFKSSFDKKLIEELRIEYLRNFCREQDIYSFVKNLNEYKAILEKEDATNKAKTREIVSSYKRLMREIEALSPKEITNIDALLSLCPTEEDKLQLAQFIYEHNMNEYKLLEDEYDEILNAKKTKYLMLLKEVDVTPTKKELDTLLEKDFVEVEKIVKRLKKISFDKDKIISMINIYDEDLFSKIEPLLEEKLISSRSLVDHFEELADENKLKNLFKNTKAFLNSSIPREVICNNIELLLSDTDFTINLNILKDYKLTKLLKDGVKLDFLKTKHLEEVIDIVLENGFEWLLEEDINILNRPREDWKKIELRNALGVEVNSKEELIKVLNSDIDIVPVSEIDDYIEHDSILKSSELSSTSTKLPSILDKFNNTSRTYLIGDRIISKQRVKRNYAKSQFLDKIEEGRALLTSILDGGIFDEDDHYNISMQLKKAKKSN